MPGTLGGAFVVDYLGPKWTMVKPYVYHYCLSANVSSIDHWSVVPSRNRLHYEWSL